MIFRWCFSRPVREAGYLCHRVRKLVDAQRDLLGSEALNSVSQAITGVRAVLANGADRKALSSAAENLETAANKWLRPYPYAGARENVDVMVVALVVALAIRTFFLQPMAIPTGSMQPTLFGITHEDLRGESRPAIPGLMERLFDRFVRGISYCHVIAQEDGVFQGFQPAQVIFPFVKRQQLVVSGRAYPVWFPPDTIEERAGIQIGQSVHKGEDIIKLKVIGGDRLFVDRLTYNFRRPHRGEIIIFASHGLPMLTPDTHYIKRLVGLPGETLRIGNDRHLIVNGKRLDAATPGFENLYSFDGDPKENQYSGHVNNVIAGKFNRPPMAPLFQDENAELTVSAKHFLVMGDNTMNSHDSRYWGDFPQEKVIGKCAFVFWPITRRFGWGFL